MVKELMREDPTGSAYSTTSQSCPCTTDEKTLPQHAAQSNTMEEPPSDSDDIRRYEGYPLLQDLQRHQRVRDLSFHCDGVDQFVYPKGNGGWLETLCIIRGRALNNIWAPWCIVVLHSIVVISVFEFGPFDGDEIDSAIGDWADFYGLVLNVVLSFLLVFRLNRAAARYWEARKFWGVFIAIGRTMTSGILSHGGHNPDLRDDAIRWAATVAVSVMSFMRGELILPPHTLDGILQKHDLEQLQAAKHMPIYASDRVRDALQRLFRVTEETSPSLAFSWTTQRDRLEGELNAYMAQYGAMERIRATPLPIVYVTHLRTFLLIHLFLFPYVFGPGQHWATIPLTMITAFAFLGIEGASMEVENPFKKDHVNNLNMGALALALIQNIQQQVQTKADLEISRRR